MDIIYYIIPLSFVMGLVNSIAGGGGVFGVPALLALGLPPINALALNRISDLGNIVGSLRNYMRTKDFHLKTGLLAIPLILAGAFIGANLIVGISENLLNKIILGAVLIGIVFTIYPIKPKEKEATPRRYIIGIIALFLLGLWDGAFAMAGGTFGVLILVMLFHHSFLGAKSIITFAAVPETILTMGILWYNSTVELDIAAVMFLSAVVGSFIGSKLAIKKGSYFIRYAMVVMALIMVTKILLIDIFAFF